jgi:hypothetical protein
MFNQFRVRYPKGSLITELSAIDHGKYIVRCLVQDEGNTLVTSLAAAETVELAEDQARSRALAILDLDPTTATEEKETTPVTSEVAIPLKPMQMASKAFSDAPSVAAATLSENLGQSKPARFPEVTKATDIGSLSFSESRREDVADQSATMPLVAEEIPFTEEFSSVEVETSQEVETPLWMVEKEKKSPAQFNEVPAPSYSPTELETSTIQMPSTDTPVDFSDIIARTNVELKRLGWTNQQGRDYLVQTYGKRSRQLLSDGELLDFLHHLESEPTPE